MKKNFLLTFALIFIAAFIATTRAAHAKTPIDGDRIAGSDRYQTSINISKIGWPNGSDYAVIATGRDFPDALSAAPLAKKFNAPILLTDVKDLDTRLNLELDRLKVKKAYIIGGTGAVSKISEDKIRAKGINAVRLSGADRYETSVKVASEIGYSSKVVVASGSNYPDALSIASIAASNGMPILLTDCNKLPDSIKNYLRNTNISETYVVGGTGAVSETVASQLKNAKRIFGKDRFETNAEVIKNFLSELNFSKVYIATGNDFPDALSGSALAAMAKSPIILTNTGLLSKTKGYIDSVSGSINEAYILGGEGVVSDTAVAGVAPPMFMGVEIKMPSQAVLLNKQLQIYAEARMIPSSASLKPAVSLSVNNPNIIRIDQNGTITGLMVGSAKVIAASGAKTASADIVVRDKRLIVLDPGHGGTSPGAVPLSQDGRKRLSDSREAVLTFRVAQKVKTRLENAGYSVIMTRNGDDTVSLEKRAMIANDAYADMFISIHYDSSTSRSANGTSAYYSSYKPNTPYTDLHVYAVRSGPVYSTSGGYLGTLTSGSKYKFINTYEDEKGDEYILFNFNGNTAKLSVKTNYITVRNSTPTDIAAQSRELAVRISSAISSLGIANKGVFENDFAVNRMTNMTSVLLELGFISNYSEFIKITQDSFQDQVADKITQSVVEFYRARE